MCVCFYFYFFFPITEMPVQIPAFLRNCGLRLNCHVTHMTVAACLFERLHKLESGQFIAAL